jgi:hypothetical protein
VRLPCGYGGAEAQPGSVKASHLLRFLGLQGAVSGLRLHVAQFVAHFSPRFTSFFEIHFAARVEVTVGSIRSASAR